MKKTVVISLGGSQIIPDDVNFSYLKEFRKVILENSRHFRIVIVCGGGSLARKYINAVKRGGGNVYHQSLVGIAATRSNARFLSYFFGFDPEWGIPKNIETLERYLRKRSLVICGGLEYKPEQTSDSTSAIIARRLDGEFVNLTDVKGLYTKDPKKYPDAKLIKHITWANFYRMANRLDFRPGQHFVLDQGASGIIMRNKIKTVIMKNVKDLDNFLSGKKFTGTVIEG
jgi:uridylate kinase